MNKPYEDARKLIEGTVENPARRGPGAISLLTWFAAGAAVGSAVMYLLDPQHGPARRNKLRDRGTAWTSEAASFAAEKTRGLKESAQGLWSKVSGVLPGHDETLAENTQAKPETYLH